MKLPIRTLGLAVGALLIGSALAPVSAQQQQSGVDGQVALRSDGALYLISGGQRRWISTVATTDEEINALPEGDPIFTGLAPQGSPQASTAQTKPSPSTSSAASTSAASTSASTAAPKPTSTTTKPSSTTTSTSDGSELDPSIPIQVDIDGSTTLGPGDSRTVEIKTRRGVTCELVVELPGDDDITEDSQSADNQGRCQYTIEIPSDTDEGDGKVIGSVREGGKVNRQEITIEIEE